MKSFSLRAAAAAATALLGASSVYANNNASTNAAKFAQLKALATQVDKINALDDSDFVFNFLDPTATRTVGAGGSITLANQHSFPALLTSSGISMALGILGPCTVNSPHTHPRATEFNVALNGTLYTGMLMENEARFVVNNVNALSATFFPPGAIHFEANLNCDPVYFIAAFDDNDPGVQQVAQRFFGLPPEIVGAALGGLGVETIQAIDTAIPDNIIYATSECARACGINYGPQPVAQQQPRTHGNAFNSPIPVPTPPYGYRPPAYAPPPSMPTYPPAGSGSGSGTGAAAGSAPGGYSLSGSGGAGGLPAGGSGSGGSGTAEALVALAQGGSGGSGGSDSTKTLVIVLIAVNAVLVLGVLAGGAYMLFFRKKQGGNGMGGGYGRTQMRYQTPSEQPGMGKYEDS